ncbi:hypothetical protein K457DRAFT_333467 [Linnemannia elongata AG-77]|uniref:Uncharacterized protein n=1 Tax=Linnemannia elongata AG-77 TaxID=1314771 RepID=A0A197JB94_9FUNG|nr:hypothetical protein K457DRAFT_333467 [Linnemannia elongata AG-77]
MLLSGKAPTPCYEACGKVIPYWWHKVNGQCWCPPNIIYRFSEPNSNLSVCLDCVVADENRKDG